MECRLETGRTHQIRVHMAHIGHPVIGDPDYGKAFRTKANRLPEPLRAAVTGFPRQALHAWLLAFRHPQTHDADAIRGADARRHGGIGCRVPGAEGLAKPVVHFDVTHCSILNKCVYFPGLFLYKSVGVGVA